MDLLDRPPKAPPINVQIERHPRYKKLHLVGTEGRTLCLLPYGEGVSGVNATEVRAKVTCRNCLVRMGRRREAS